MNDNNLAKRERMPEFQELLSSIEGVANKYDLMSVELKNKLEQIYCRPTPIRSDVAAMDKVVAQPNDIIGSISQQVERLNLLSQRYDYLLEQLNKII